MIHGGLFQLWIFCDRIRPLLVLIWWREGGRWSNKCISHSLIGATSVPDSGYRAHTHTHRVNISVCWLTSTKGTQRLWRFILFIAAVADPVNQVYSFKGKQNHLGFQKNTALTLDSVLYQPLSLKLSVYGGSFCKKMLWMLFVLSRNEIFNLSIGWLDARHWFWPRLEVWPWHSEGCRAYTPHLIWKYKKPAQIITNSVPLMIWEILLELFCKFSSVYFWWGD